MDEATDMQITVSVTRSIPTYHLGKSTHLAIRRARGAVDFQSHRAQLHLVC